VTSANGFAPTSASRSPNCRPRRPKGRPRPRPRRNRRIKIASKTRRSALLDEIRSFTYSPTGENRGRDTLAHAEVIKIATDFLLTKPTMQHILVGGYPFLLIDESQDTNGPLMDAFFAVQATHPQAVRTSACWVT